MILTLDSDEAKVVRYALKELANKRLEQAWDANSKPEWAAANEAEAKRLYALADRIAVEARDL